MKNTIKGIAIGIIGSLFILGGQPIKTSEPVPAMSQITNDVLAILKDVTLATVTKDNVAQAVAELSLNANRLKNFRIIAEAIAQIPNEQIQDAFRLLSYIGNKLPIYFVTNIQRVLSTITYATDGAKELLKWSAKNIIQRGSEILSEGVTGHFGTFLSGFDKTMEGFTDKTNQVVGGAYDFLSNFSMRDLYNSIPRAQDLASLARENPKTALVAAIGASVIFTYLAKSYLNKKPKQEQRKPKQEQRYLLKDKNIMSDENIAFLAKRFLEDIKIIRLDLAQLDPNKKYSIQSDNKKLELKYYVVKSPEDEDIDKFVFTEILIQEGKITVSLGEVNQEVKYNEIMTNFTNEQGYLMNIRSKLKYILESRIQI